MTPLQQLDLAGLHVLDGGMATELERQGCDLSGPLWSAQVIEDAPEAIAAVHRAYLEAGADCLLTASYQVSAEGFQQLGRDAATAAGDAAGALQDAVSIAVRARDAYRKVSPRRIWIAASLGPYGAMLHNGAEYHGNYECSFAELVQFHRRRMDVLASTDADFLALESVPSLAEAKALIEALHFFPHLAAYISFTCKDGSHVAHGETLQACGRLLDQEPQVIGMGVNCTRPALITSLVEELAQVTKKPIVVYPNSGEEWDPVHRCWRGDGELASYGALAQTWRTAGAQWIGGCCRTGPAHVSAVAQVWKT